MNVVFWLEYPLFHVAALIKSLSLRSGVKVVVVAEYDIPQWRLDMGFSRPDFGLAEEFFLPSKKERNKLVRSYSSAGDYHIFHGLRHVKKNFHCFKKLVFKDAGLGLYFEPQQFEGNIKAKLRRLYYKFLFARYGRRLDFMLALGQLGRNQYVNLGLPESKVFSFKYHLDNQVTFNYFNTHGLKLTFLYAGQLVERKNVGLVLDALKLFPRNVLSNIEFLIIGDGAEKQKLKEKVLRYELGGAVRFLSSMPNEELKKYYLSSDVFILPSKFEGWGAVATEAMALGLPVIVSDGCASSCIIEDDSHGYVFNNNSSESLYEKMKFYVEGDKKIVSKESRKKRALYSLEKFSGSVGCECLLNILKKTRN